ncbi:hypothetical protein D9Q98_006570 [Chlorella vulgaris]|uniref:Uncharacterized protein n=1 Tax=Chlorella vulgaris TaxID=3077 RepID=A0A9D4YVG3_CHLVU|nr:hypothetical protein D9Q98_006570 [Chlorella vulgaris]
MRAQWDDQLRRLLSEAVISGYVLVDQRDGTIIASFGELCCEFDVEPKIGCTLLRLFSAGVPQDALQVLGEKLVIVQRTEGSVYAVGRGKGLTAHYLPCGILATVYRQPNLARTVVPLVEAICDVLRQP